jgi:DNA-binding NarL/FixJ family response regulator
VSLIRLVIVDDHAVVRSGLEQMLANYDDVEVVGLAQSGREGIALSKELDPDVVLMDLNMPGVGGIEATAAITASTSAEVVVLTSFSEPDKVMAALDAGAIGYLLKDAEPHQIVDGVRAAARKESPLDPRAARTLVGARREAPASHALTDREREVLVLLVGGLSNKQIARRLGIAEKTVKTHLSSAFRTIGVQDRTQAALWARSNGLG